MLVDFSWISRSTNSGPRNAYRTSDGRYVALSASTQKMAERVFVSIGRAELVAELDGVEQVFNITFVAAFPVDPAGSGGRQLYTGRAALLPRRSKRTLP